MTLGLTSILFAFLSQSLWAQTDFLRIEDVRPGMKGVGKTCFEGAQPAEFQVEVLGVLNNTGPGEDSILARFSGGPLGETGVFQGMSGSPVFIDGKLLGAVAYSYSFPKAAIGGITPIRQMVDAFRVPVATRTGGRARLNRNSLWNYRLRKPGADSNLAQFMSEMLPYVLTPGIGPLSGHSLVPIATPLNLGGFAPETLKLFSQQFHALGFAAVQGAATSGAAEPWQSEALEPGSNLVVSLVSGDLDVSAAGTVTFISGDKLYAFGHPLFNLGFTQLPIHRGRVITVFPSLQSSFKILEAGASVGVIRQDRNSGIYGVLGQEAEMIPVNLSMTTSRGVEKRLRFDVALDPFLTPFMLNLTVFNTIVASERSLGLSTLQVDGKIFVKDQDAVEIHSRFSSNSNSPVFASLSVAVPIGFLLSSGHEEITFENIDLEILALEDDRAALLDSVRMDRSEVTAGASFNLEVTARKNDGQTLKESYPVKLPPDISPGHVSILVADGTSVMARDAREQSGNVIPRNLEQLIRLINNVRKNDRIYVRIFRSEPGVVIHGEGMPGLPPSILSILDSERSSGGVHPIRMSVLMEYELPPTDYIIAGSRVLNLEIRP